MWSASFHQLGPGMEGRELPEQGHAFFALLLLPALGRDVTSSLKQSPLRLPNMICCNPGL